MTSSTTSPAQDGPLAPATLELLTDALHSLQQGDAAGAAGSARGAAGTSALGDALDTYLSRAPGAAVYDSPAAFRAFIRGGGNVELYRRTVAALSSEYRRRSVRTLLDIGCGDGLALVPAVAAADPPPAELDLVEPSAALLDRCLAALAEQPGRPGIIRPWQLGLTEFLDAAPADRDWDLAQSTFALQSIPDTERAEALDRLATRVGGLLLVDFDVAHPDRAGRDDVRALAQRYERGLREYDEDRDLVAQGFLMPVLVGQLSTHTARTNWEHPADHWAEQVARAGFGQVRVDKLDDYWSSPAFVLTAVGAR